jgi:hypothetical protein
LRAPVVLVEAAQIASMTGTRVYRAATSSEEVAVLARLTRQLQHLANLRQHGVGQARLDEKRIDPSGLGSNNRVREGMTCEREHRDVRRPGVRLVSRRVASQPSMRGSPMSIKIKAGIASVAKRTACSPSSASITRKSWKPEYVA